MTTSVSGLQDASLRWDMICFMLSIVPFLCGGRRG